MIHRAIMDAMPTDGSVPPIAWGYVVGSPPEGRLHAALIPDPGDATEETAEFAPVTFGEQRRSGGEAMIMDTMRLAVTGPVRGGIACMAMAERIADVIAGMEGQRFPDSGTRDFLATGAGANAHPPHIQAAIDQYSLTLVGALRVIGVLRGRPGYVETRETQAVTVELPLVIRWAVLEVNP